jgi:hypothetical protein
MNWQILLDISAAFLLLGLALAGVYEALAIINLYIPFTHNIPLISSIVKPWVHNHLGIALAIAAIFVGAIFWLFFHFFLSK